MKLIEDLGMQYLTENSKRTCRIGLYECPCCSKHFKCQVDHVNSGHTTKCRSCACKLANAAKSLKAASEFKSKATEVHGDKYDYSSVVYTNSRDKVKIICKKHGEFLQTPSGHISGKGCKECANEAHSRQQVEKASIEFIDKAVAVHGYLYDYTLFKYKNAKTKGDIICNSCNTKFVQCPGNHLSGQGCPECAKERRNIAMRMSEKNDRPTTLYYIYFPEVNLWKVGCTTRALTERFRQEKLEYTIIQTKEYASGSEAYRIEKFILDATKASQYKGKILGSNGSSELRTQPIENLDYLITMATDCLTT